MSVLSEMKCQIAAVPCNPFKIVRIWPKTIKKAAFPRFPLQKHRTTGEDLCAVEGDAGVTLLAQVVKAAARLQPSGRATFAGTGASRLDPGHKPGSYASMLAIGKHILVP